MAESLGHTVTYAFFVAYFVIYLIMLVLSIIICLLYIIPMKMQHPQIWGFYLCTTILYILTSCEMAYYIFFGNIESYNVDHDFSLDGLTKPQVVLSQLCDCFIKAIFLLITLTMYHLYLSLAYVNHKFDSMEQVDRMKFLSALGFWLMILLVLMSEIPTMFDLEMNI